MTEPKTKKEMKVEEFNEVNTLISKLIDDLKSHDHINITGAIKDLQSAGKRVSDYFYKYEPKNDN